MENVIQINYSLNIFDIRYNQLDSDAIILLQEICRQYFTTLGECYIINDISENDLMLYTNEKKEIDSEHIHQIIKDKSIFILSIYIVFIDLLNFIIENCKGNKVNDYYIELLLNVISSKYSCEELKDEVISGFDEDGKIYKLLNGVYSQYIFKYDSIKCDYICIAIDYLEEISDSELIYILEELKMTKRIRNLSINSIRL